MEWVRQLNSEPRTRSALHPAFREELDRYFADDIAELEGLLGRRLWSESQQLIQCLGPHLRNLSLADSRARATPHRRPVEISAALALAANSSDGGHRLAPVRQVEQGIERQFPVRATIEWLDAASTA